jgi:hypothetical protein
MIDLVLQQSNLMAQLPEIFYAVEEDLATQYTEDELTDQGNLYVVYRALNGRVWSPELEAGLTEAQKAYLLGLAKGGHIEVSIVRRDCELNEVSIPLEFKNAVSAHHAKFTFTLTIGFCEVNSSGSSLLSADTLVSELELFAIDTCSLRLLILSVTTPN